MSIDSKDHPGPQRSCDSSPGPGRCKGQRGEPDNSVACLARLPEYPGEISILSPAGQQRLGGPKVWMAKHRFVELLVGRIFLFLSS